MEAIGKSQKRTILFKKILAYVLLTIGGVIIALPFVWMVSTALKEPSQIFTFPIEWIPEPFVWENFAEALTIRPFDRYAANTALISALTVIGQVLSSSIVAYSFARLKWPGRNKLFFIILATMMLPKSMTLVPKFVIFANLGWVNTFLPLVVPQFFGFPFFIFLMRQFFMTFPKSMDEAAKIDGCGILGIYWRIILPMSKPVIGIVAIQAFTNSWNDFINPLIYLNDSKLWTLTLGLRAFQQQFTVDWHLLMAASLVVMLPVLFLFFFAQKYFIQGIVFTGVKG
ncbi:MAG: carbohydrate ABC transporter permease [Halothermotrichaceae bacterium]